MSSEADQPQYTGLQRAFILFMLTTTVALYAMSVTIANVSLPQMQGSLSATQDQIAWIVTFNIVATAVATPLTGWLTGRFGQRQLLLSAVVLFTLFSLLCGLANSLPELVFYRIGQGAAGAPLAPLCQAIVLSAYPQRQHGTATAVFGMGVVIGPILAPTIGGYLSEEYSWRWVFYMIVPCGLLSLVGCWSVVPEGLKQGRTRFDWTGFLALGLAVAALQLMLDRGERNDWFESTEIVLEAVIALAGFYIFFVHSFTADKPFLNPRLGLDRNFVIGILLTLIFGMLNFTPLTLLPPLLKTLQGYPDSVIGILLATRGAGTLLGFFVLLLGSKYDPRIWLVLGFSLQGIAGWYMAQFDIYVTFFDVAWTSFLQGLGVGFLWVPLTLVTFMTLPRELFPEGSSVFHLLRNVGSSIHISISIALVIRTAKVNYGHLVEDVTQFDKGLPWVVGQWTTESLAGIAAVSGEMQRQGLMIGYVNAFYMYAFTAFAVLPLIVLVRRRPVAD